ncbi:27698_t:CDS:2, partial [Gigaspora margarita]
MIRSRFISSIETQQIDDDDLLKFCCRITSKSRRNKRKNNRTRLSGGIKRSNNSKHDSVPLDDEEWEMLEDGELFRDLVLLALNDTCPCNYVERLSDLIAQGKCMLARSGVHLLDVGIIKLDNSSVGIIYNRALHKLERLAVENRVHKIRSRFISSIETQQIDDNVLIFFSGIVWMFCCVTCVDRGLLKFCCRITSKSRRNKRKNNRTRLSGGIKRSNNSKHDSVPLDDEEWEMLEDGELFRD